MSNRELHMYELKSDALETVIAYDEADATKVYEEHCGEPISELIAGDPEWKLIADDATVSLLGDEPIGVEGETRHDEHTWRATMTARQWIEREGRGLFSSTEC